MSTCNYTVGIGYYVSQGRDNWAYYVAKSSKRSWKSQRRDYPNSCKLVHYEKYTIVVDAAQESGHKLKSWIPNIIIFHQETIKYSISQNLLVAQTSIQA